MMDLPRPSGGSVGRNRSGVLELAVLGLLRETPMHGYELRKRLYTVLGVTLVIVLRTMSRRWRTEDADDEPGPYSPEAPPPTDLAAGAAG